MVTALAAAGVVAIHVSVQTQQKRQWAGDLPAYLVGWRLAKSNPSKIYDLDTQRAMAGQILAKPGPVPACPFNYPPHLAAIGRWFPNLTYNATIVPWVIFMIITVLAAILIWTRSSPHRIAIAATMIAAPPTVAAIASGSILPLTIIGAILVVGGFRRSRFDASSIAIGTFGWILLAIKPHLAALVAIAALILVTRKAIVTLLAAAPIIVVLPTVAFGPSIWMRWISFLQQFSKSTEGDLLCRVPRTSPNLEGVLTRLHLTPNAFLVWGIYLIAIVAITIWTYKTRPDFAQATMVIAALIPIVAPHANPQDLLLTLPLILSATFAWAEKKSPRLIAIAGVCIVSMVLPISIYTILVQALLVCVLFYSGVTFLKRRAKSSIHI